MGDKIKNTNSEIYEKKNINMICKELVSWVTRL